MKKRNDQFKKERRFFIKSTLGFSAALPFLSSLQPTQAQGIIPNLLMIRLPHGGIPFDRYFGPNTPSQTEVIDSGQYGFRHQSLAELAANNGGQVSEILSSQWTSQLNKMSLITGLTSLPMWNNHNHAAFAGLHMISHNFYDGTWNFKENSPDSIKARSTIDQVIAEEYAARGWNDRVLAPADLIGMQLFPTSWKMNDQGELEDNYYVHQPLNVLQALFPGGETNDNLIASNEKVMDSLLPEINRLKNSNRLSTEDRRRLNLYFEAMDQAITNFRRLQGANCTTPTDISNNYASGEAHASYALLFALAMSCGLSHLISYQAARPRGLAYGGGGSSGWHQAAHENASPEHQDTLTDATKNFINDFLDPMMSHLNSFGILDDTLIAMSHEHSFPHKMVGLSYLLAGGSNLGINHGNRIDYQNIEAYTGQVHQSYSNGNANPIPERYAPYNRFGLYTSNLFHGILASFGVRQSIIQRHSTAGDAYGDQLTDDMASRFNAATFDSVSSFQQLKSACNAAYNGNFKRYSKLPILWNS